MSSESSEASLGESIRFWTLFLASPQLSSHDRLAALINLANALSDFGDETGDVSRCDEAVIHGRAALDLAPEGSPEQITIFSDLATVYQTRFELQGNRNDLTQSLELVRLAVARTPANHPSRFARYSNLAGILSTVYEFFGKVEDLEDAIIAAQRSISPDLAPDLLAKVLGNKARALSQRYERYQILTDLEEAISVTKSAHDCAQDPSIKQLCGNNLVGLLIFRAERDCTEETVDTAVEEGQRIYEAAGGPTRAMLAHNLSYLKRLKFERINQDGDPRDLQSALDFAVDAANFPADDNNLAMYRDNLAICLEHEYKRSPSNETLTLAIRQARLAVNLLSPDHIAVSNYSNHLADLLKIRRTAEDIRESIDISKSVLMQEHALQLNRIAAGQRCGFLHADLEEWKEASIFFEQAVNLIPSLAQRSLQRRDQQNVLSQLTGLSQSAASAALEAKNTPAKAFEILECGRSVLLQLAIATKSVFIPELANVPEAKLLLECHQNTKDVVSRPQGRGMQLDSDSIAVSANTTARLQALEEMRRLEKDMTFMATGLGINIRKRFDAGDTACLGQDFAVAFNITKYRSDAFIMTSQSIESVSLPLVEIGKLREYAACLIGPERITRIDSATYRSSNNKLQEILNWLWKVAVRPILSHLRLLNRRHSDASLPRICWITSGTLGLMPLHAAGDHSPLSKDFAMNYAISSYAASYQALQWCRGRLAGRSLLESPVQMRVAAITMRETPGFATLDCIEEDLESLRSAVPDAREEREPSAQQAQELFQSVSVVHTACHARPDIEDPSAGCILLHGNGDKVVDKLSIYTISQLDTSSAWLAYLSACQTADIQNLDYLDEAIHIAGAFQTAGFPQVVGTLWQAEDDYAAAVTKKFYGNSDLRDTMTGKIPIHHDIATRAFHEAIHDIRAEDPELVLSWAQFTIFGA